MSRISGSSIAATAIVADVLERYPPAMRVFIDHGMACIGCVVAPYHTIEEACLEYGVPLEAFRREIADAVNAAGQ